MTTDRTLLSRWSVAEQALIASLRKEPSRVSVELIRLWSLSFPFPWQPDDTRPERDELVRKLLRVTRQYSAQLLDAGSFVLERGGMSVETDEAAEQVTRALQFLGDKTLLARFAERSDPAAVLAAVAIAAISAAAKGRRDMLDLARAASMQVRLLRLFTELERQYARRSTPARSTRRDEMRALAALPRGKTRELRRQFPHILRENVVKHVATHGSIRGWLKKMAIDYDVDNRTIKKHLVMDLGEAEGQAFLQQYFATARSAD